MLAGLRWPEAEGQHLCLFTFTLSLQINVTSSVWCCFLQNMCVSSTKYAVSILTLCKSLNRLFYYYWPTGNYNTWLTFPKLPKKYMLSFMGRFTFFRGLNEILCEATLPYNIPKIKNDQGRVWELTYAIMT